MWKRFVSLVVLMLVPVAVSAQTLHGHPQLAAYASPADWPYREAQCHWPNKLNTIAATPGNVIVADLVKGTFGDAVMAHGVHVGLKCPDYAETVGAITCTGAIIAFQLAGRVAVVYGPLARDFIWDETGTSTMPVMIGDPAPHAVKRWTFKVTLDPLLGDELSRAPAHGWYGMGVAARVVFDSGDQVETAHGRAFFSVIDPSVPERPAHASGKLTTALCTPLQGPPETPFRSRFGVENVEFQDYLPVAPIQTDWSVPAKLYNYSSAMGELTQAQRDAAGIVNFPPATFEHRVGLDLHAGNPGQLLATETVLNGDDAPTRTIVFSPALMGSGTKKDAVMWSQPTAGYTAQVTALLVQDITVGPGIPPPPVVVCLPPQVSVGGKCITPTPVCMAPNVLMNGICTPPLPPVTTTTYTFVCDTAGKCTLVVK